VLLKLNYLDHKFHLYSPRELYLHLDNSDMNAFVQFSFLFPSMVTICRNLILCTKHDLLLILAIFADIDSEIDNSNEL